MVGPCSAGSSRSWLYRGGLFRPPSGDSQGPWSALPVPSDCARIFTGSAALRSRPSGAYVDKIVAEAGLACYKPVTTPLVTDYTTADFEAPTGACPNTISTTGFSARQRVSRLPRGTHHAVAALRARGLSASSTTVVRDSAGIDARSRRSCTHHPIHQRYRTPRTIVRTIGRGIRTHRLMRRLARVRGASDRIWILQVALRLVYHRVGRLHPRVFSNAAADGTPDDRVRAHRVRPTHQEPAHDAPHLRLHTRRFADDQRDLLR